MPFDYLRRMFDRGLNLVLINISVTQLDLSKSFDNIETSGLHIFLISA